MGYVWLGLGQVSLGQG